MDTRGSESTDSQFEPVPRHLDAIAREVVDSAFTIHKALGPGLLESVYQACMIHELTRRNLHVQKEVPVPVQYDGIQIEAGLRLDLLVEDQVVIELKAIEKLLPVHKAQAMTYLKLTGNRLAFLINFNVPLIKDGIHRIVL